MNNTEDEDGKSSDQTEAMHDREITLADGRYMIFYTFGSTEEESNEGSDV